VGKAEFLASRFGICIAMSVLERDKSCISPNNIVRQEDKSGIFPDKVVGQKNKPGIFLDWLVRQ